MADRFRHFLAIDWSGARGERQKGIALAMAALDGAPPRLIGNPGGWSRAAVLGLLRDNLPEDTLVGLDLGISLPFADCGAFFPGWQASPEDAPSLWALVERICAGDPHLSAQSFVDHDEASRYFRRDKGREGAAFRCDRASHGRGRFRVAELMQAQQGCTPYSNFNLVGAAQVGKSSLTGMRVLHALRGYLPVWPVDDLPETGSVLVEIYTTIAAIAANRTARKSKIRDHAELAAALQALGSPAVDNYGPIDDHSADALITAAWLRANAGRKELWSPKALTDKIAQTEGWTFGVA
ncbi:hypothetical protein FHS61_000128 [Altererythrobacter atlanticus]|uniref:Uncharacterized protein n=1 Tax=Croceibacterium atlanticum TaxID=1267766 RepID=A0A0F7KPA8_9SPHN|nr:hypothetical protein [Croceibacterium atlanticum]AKH42358.1 hypothetical protein WYH_01315 [Croceibacterium atlanticum]MBB5731135.1 hypothetical protein [Croceibacterium atlanticum]